MSGLQRGAATLIGNKGTTIEVEYITSSFSPTHGFGLGKDSKGNIYKIHF